MATNALVDPKPVLRIRIDDLPGLPEDLETELAAGRRIELVRADKVVAEVREPGVQLPQVTAANFDWAAQLKEMWGDRVFDVDTTQWIREDRDARG